MIYMYFNHVIYSSWLNESVCPNDFKVNYVVGLYVKLFLKSLFMTKRNAKCPYYVDACARKERRDKVQKLHFPST